MSEKNKTIAKIYFSPTGFGLLKELMKTLRNRIPQYPSRISRRFLGQGWRRKTKLMVITPLLPLDLTMNCRLIFY
jgi:hypothetical protein